ncbi:MAG: DUF3097 family protein [Bowdeniella nasicola]|nr:DUF3097 family protein [Bowdeniella nasicola]
MIDRYGTDIFTHDPHAARRAQRARAREIPASLGEVVEEVETGWVGEITRVEKSGGLHVVELTDRHERVRTFPLGPGFLLDGAPVILTPPRPCERTGAGRGAPPPRRTASGSLARPDARSTVALPSRIFVEGRHDADLIQKVWGEDLGYDGVAVELLEGVDRLEEVLAAFGPGPGRRAGVLVDHFVPGSKESRHVERVLAHLPGAPHVLVLGHPYVDVWQAVKPHRVGLSAWPNVPRSMDIKVGTLHALGLPAETQADIAAGWRAILARVRDYRDVEASLIGRVEELIDFVLSDRYGPSSV